jgi:hypothetical protein
MLSGLGGGGRERERERERGEGGGGVASSHQRSMADFGNSTYSVSGFSTK